MPSILEEWQDVIRDTPTYGTFEEDGEDWLQPFSSATDMDGQLHKPMPRQENPLPPPLDAPGPIMSYHAQPPRLQPQQSFNSRDQYSHTDFASPTYTSAPATLQGQTSWNPPPQILDLRPDDLISNPGFNFLCDEYRVTLNDRLKQHYEILQCSADPDAWAVATIKIQQITQEVYGLSRRHDESRKGKARALDEQPYTLPPSNPLTQAPQTDFLAQIAQLPQQPHLQQQQPFPLPTQPPSSLMGQQTLFPSETLPQAQQHNTPSTGRWYRELRPRPAYQAPPLISQEQQPLVQTAVVQIPQWKRTGILTWAPQLSHLVHEIGSPITDTHIEDSPMRQMAVNYLRFFMERMSPDCRRWVEDDLIPFLIRAKQAGVDPAVAVEGF